VTSDPLAAYDVSPTRGFVPEQAPATSLPPPWSAFDELAVTLPSRLATGTILADVAELPRLDAAALDALRTPADRERAFLVTTAIASAVVHAPDGTGDRVPAPVAVPMAAVATVLDRPGIPSWASLGMRNWRLRDGVAAGSVPSADDADLLVAFDGGQDESWFFLATLEVEVAGGRLPGLAHHGLAVAADGSDGELAALLTDVAGQVATATATLDRMYVGCDPDGFTHRVRPWIGGWGDDGVLLEGVDDRRRHHVGATAAQSPLIAVVDELLGIEHRGPTGDFLRAMRAYMPVGPRQLLADVGAGSRVRDRVADGGDTLDEAYVAAVRAVERFRREHMRLVHDYVVVPSRATAEEATGTGGTTVAGFLRESRRDTLDALSEH
jgi:indoleamine 2,3-dioxygenase